MSIDTTAEPVPRQRTDDEHGPWWVPPAVWLLVVLHGLLLVAYSQLAPPWRAPDEPQHLDMVLAVRTGQGWPGPGERALSRQVTETFPLAGFAFEDIRTLPPLEAARAPARQHRPTFAEVADDQPSGAENGMWQHPPLYYTALASVLMAVEALVPGGGDWSWDRMLGVARLFSVALVVWLPLLAFVAARRVEADRRTALTAGVLVLAVPQLTHIGSSVNNDNLVVLAVSALAVPLAGVLTGDLRRRTAAVVGALLGVALLAKGFGLFAIGWVALAYLAGGWRRDRRAAVGAGAVALGLGMVVGGWWYLRNLVMFGTLQPTSFSLVADEGFTPEIAFWLGRFVTWMVRRFWGSFGWYQAQIPGWVAWAAAATAVALLVAGLVRGRIGGVATRLLLAFPLVALLALTALRAWRTYVDSGFPAAIQGRYLLAGLVPASVVVAGGITAAARRWRAWAPLAALAAAALLHLSAITAMLRVFWAEPAAVLAWSPWPSWLLAGAGAAIVAVAVVLARGLAREARGR